MQSPRTTPLRRSGAGAVPALRGRIEGHLPPPTIVDVQVVEPDELTRSCAAWTTTATELDAAIAERAKGWTLARMPVLDLNVLRIGGVRAGRPDVPVAVVIDEAVELAKRFSTDDTGASSTASCRRSSPMSVRAV